VAIPAAARRRRRCGGPAHTGVVRRRHVPVGPAAALHLCCDVCARRSDVADCAADRGQQDHHRYRSRQGREGDGGSGDLTAAGRRQCRSVCRHGNGSAMVPPGHHCADANAGQHGQYCGCCVSCGANRRLVAAWMRRGGGLPVRLLQGLGRPRRCRLSQRHWAPL